MKISLDAAMRARDVSAPSDADDIAADEPTESAVEETTDDDGRAVSERSQGHPRSRHRPRLRHDQRSDRPAFDEPGGYGSGGSSPFAS